MVLELGTLFYEVHELGEMSLRMLKSGKLGEVSLGMLKLGELGELWNVNLNL